MKTPLTLIALILFFIQVQLSFNFNNIFNKTYWSGGYDFNRLFPGAPRNFLATIFYTL
ncbi:MAG: hypothetical protein ACTHLE_23065 [Agriterribacter sp.]